MKHVGTLTWKPSGETQEAFEELSLLVHSMVEDRDHIQACGGQAECGTCRVTVLSDPSLLTEPTLDERELFEEHPDAFAPNERLACQCRPLGDVVVEVPAVPPKDLRFD